MQKEGTGTKDQKKTCRQIIKKRPESKKTCKTELKHQQWSSSTILADPFKNALRHAQCDFFRRFVGILLCVVKVALRTTSMSVFVNLPCHRSPNVFNWTVTFFKWALYTAEVLLKVIIEQSRWMPTATSHHIQPLFFTPAQPEDVLFKMTNK
ncbi:hypothetical protein XENOCAPTIV_002880 [Xenoophorus captivus]|uniref:Uncharacterized protein n=1 Tax=Xenoophorus captivus TaxID=1517983 RepID=A0ABV0Q8F6_9TELE